MSKVSDSYDNVIRGVSEQVPHDRVVGQHWSQDNLISDPVRGLSRRHGSIYHHRLPLARAISAVDRLDASTRNEQTLFVDGIEYGVLYRPNAIAGSQIYPLVITNKDTRQFVQVISDGQATDEVLGAGISTMTAAGRYVLIASSSRKVEYSTANNMTASSDKHVVWIRGGANSRDFTVYVNVGATSNKFTYRTMAAYYEGKLDTSDIDPNPGGTPDPLYQKKINDRVNAYNTAVSQHIAAVALDITPGNIAKKLTALIVASGIRCGVDGPYIKIVQPGATVTVDDGGNGDFMRAVSNDITAAELVSPRHWDGKIVKVVPKQANSLAFYLKAESTSGQTGEFGEVIWRETAGIGVNLSWVFAIGMFLGEYFYVARNSAGLAALTGTTVPPIEPASSGDLDSSPIPEFFDRTITHMRMFQDRLMIVAGSTVFLSKSGDYFNFFRKSALTVSPDDPIEVFAQGTEDDVITTGVQHDRNVILCGKRYQYIVPGRENMTPNNPYVGVQATYEDANLTAHAVAGSLLFFCQRREKRLTLQQMSPGAVADRLDAFDVSAQLDGYLTGTPKQIVAMTAPGVVFVRTQELTNGFYVYSYLDANDQSERLFDSWSRWTVNEALGTLVGITPDDSGLLAITLRDTTVGPQLILDRFSRETAPSTYPYLDSHTLEADSILLNTGAACVFDNTSDRYLLGVDLKDRNIIKAQFPTQLGSLRAGTTYTSEAVLTSPYIRDREDKIILDARLTISKLTLSMSNSAASITSLSTDLGKTWKVAKSWIARPVGGWVLNTQEVAEEAVVTIPVMKENKAYRAKISSRSWLPLTISVVEWAGQAFTSRR